MKPGEIRVQKGAIMSPVTAVIGRLLTRVLYTAHDVGYTLRMMSRMRLQTLLNWTVAVLEKSPFLMQATYAPWS